ncbi:NPC intracellular cholesterol transporter 2 homolog a-like [Argiope bruennichi]|uniref:NPC intracellular cholesterol transporter 2 homolog a-like n=1 Tax=Argiope bruennichi TaxID=94029 RepID=UPI0024955EE4|nr:NPC intracellular cholesterol transporter 2 homolog a-like [Argiope bruennichi]
MPCHLALKLLNSFELFKIKMSPFITLILWIVLAIQVSATRFEDCGSTSQVTAVDFSGCSDDDSVCIVDRGTVQNITIKFASKEESKSVDAVVYGQVLDILLPFEVQQPDGCKSGISCPLTDGTSYTYHGSADMRELSPQTRAILEWYLKDDEYDNIVCVQISCEIK